MVNGEFLKPLKSYRFMHVHNFSKLMECQILLNVPSGKYNHSLSNAQKNKLAKLPYGMPYTYKYRGA